MLAPPWIPVPPPAYGGIEAVVATLCEALVRRGQRVTLFAAPGSRSSAEVCTPLDRAHPDEIERAVHEADHVACAFDAVDAAARAGDPFDVVHDHCGFVCFAMASRIAIPVLHTAHGPFTDISRPFYARHAHKAHVVAISHAQLRAGPANLRSVGSIPNPLELATWPFRTDKEDFLLWLGRFSPGKGAHHAISVARRTGRRLLLAGPVQPGQETYFDREVAPRVDGDRVSYLGEVDAVRKRELLAAARALLMPIRWPEPFGMVMIEAMACGTPVIAFPEGSAPEVVRHGETGLLVDDEAAMASAVERVAGIDPARCRAWVAQRYDADVVAAAYEDAYRAVIREAAPPSVMRTVAGGRERPRAANG